MSTTKPQGIPAAPDDSAAVSSLRFQGRGVLSGNAIYVERPADRELVSRLSRGEHCHVLAPRQVGKTNLRIRAARKLRQRTTSRGERIRCASVDLTSVGEASAEGWYLELVMRVLPQLELTGDVRAFWDRTSGMSPPMRLQRALRELVLAVTEDAIVLFLDEINVGVELPFLQDDFFRAILAMQSARADDAIFERLTFCLVGVATPLDLVTDVARVPFNESHGIELEDFTREEAEPFRRALGLAPGDPDAMFEEILGWTDGHPAQTQQLCERLVTDSLDGRSSEHGRIEDLVHRMYLASGATDDPLLLEIHAYFSGTGPERRDATEMLRAYRKILVKESEGGKTPFVASAEVRLRSRGLVAVRRDADGTPWLRPRNRIFREVFDLAWVDEQIRARSYFADPLTNWLLHDKSEQFVLTGGLLEDALSWAKEQESVPAEEWEFLNASRDVADRAREEQDRRREEEAAAQRLQDEERRALLEELREAQAQANEARELRRRWQTRRVYWVGITLALVLAAVAVSRLIPAKAPNRELEKALERARIAESEAQALKSLDTCPKRLAPLQLDLQECHIKLSSCETRRPPQ